MRSLIARPHRAETKFEKGASDRNSLPVGYRPNAASGRWSGEWSHECKLDPVTCDTMAV